MKGRVEFMSLPAEEIDTRPLSYPKTNKVTLGDKTVTYSGSSNTAWQLRHVCRTADWTMTTVTADLDSKSSANLE